LDNEIIGVIAPARSGKTTRVAKFVASRPRVAIYDPQAKTDTQYRMVATHIVQHDLVELGRIIAEEKEPFRVLYEPVEPVYDGVSWEFTDFAPFLKKCLRRAELIGPMTVVVDEAHFTMSMRSMPIELWRVITTGGHYGIDLVWITQRFSGVNPWARANAREYWLFRTHHPAEAKIISDICGPEIAEQVSNLRRLDQRTHPVTPAQMLRWRDGEVKIEDDLENES
jgi:hypothetical protein